jgi:hypothetical protein
MYADRLAAQRLTRDIIIEDVPEAPRIRLTRKAGRDEVERATQCAVDIRGFYGGEPPLHLHLQAATQAALDAGAAMVEAMLGVPLPSGVVVRSGMPGALSSSLRAPAPAAAAAPRARIAKSFLQSTLAR